MKDSFGREINYLRLSVTDLCNLNCKYCSTHEPTKVEHKEILKIEDMSRLVKCFSELGISKLRITGGEPLLKRGIFDLISQCSQYVSDIGLTTNGTLLLKQAKGLKKVGLKSLNISLDSLNKKVYKDVCGGNVKETLKGIKKAYKLGFKIKFNAVLQKGVNDKDIFNLLKFAKKYKAKLRYIELMPLGNTEEYFKKYYISSEEIIKQNNMIFLYQEGAAEYYKFGDYEIGFIRPISNKFCCKCNRIRMTSFGEIIPCLHSNKRYSIKEYLNETDEVIKSKLNDYIMSKPEKHFLEDGVRIDKDMRDIGG